MCNHEGSAVAVLKNPSDDLLRQIQEDDDPGNTYPPVVVLQAAFAAEWAAE